MKNERSLYVRGLGHALSTKYTDGNSVTFAPRATRPLNRFDLFIHFVERLRDRIQIVFALRDKSSKIEEIL